MVIFVDMFLLSTEQSPKKKKRERQKVILLRVSVTYVARYIVSSGLDKSLFQ